MNYFTSLKSLVALIHLAISVIAGLKDTIGELKSAISSRDSLITGQAATIEKLGADTHAGSVDIVALNQAVVDANSARNAALAHSAELESVIASGQDDQSALASILNTTSIVPSVSESFAVTTEASAIPEPAPVAVPIESASTESASNESAPTESAPATNAGEGTENSPLAGSIASM